MIKLKINGEERSWDGDPDLPLLWFLRDEVGLTGTKFGCGQALCGACTVMVDKQAVRACITSVSDVVDREVVTIEGLHPTGDHRGSEGLAPGQCPAMRLLPVRPDHAGRGPARRKIQNPPTTRYAKRWRATSAAAAVTSASKTRSISLRRESDHEHLHKSRQTSRHGNSASRSRRFPAAPSSKASASPAVWCLPHR